MPRTIAPLETAFSFLEVLQQADRERAELQIYRSAAGGEFVDPAAAAHYEMTEKTFEVAHGTWVPRRIDATLSAFIETRLAETPLYARRNAFSGDPMLVTCGVTEGLRDQVQELRRQRGAETEGEFYTITSQLYVAMLREGLVEWMLHAADQGYELRRCAQCGHWFTPQLKARSRFCNPHCRKTFNNLRASAKRDVTTFICKVCDEERPMDDFSGLRVPHDGFNDDSRLMMCAYATGLDAIPLCCIHCVRDRFPEWRRYIAPMETLAERAAR